MVWRLKNQLLTRDEKSHDHTNAELQTVKKKQNLMGLAAAHGGNGNNWEIYTILDYPRRNKYAFGNLNYGYSFF